MSSAFVSAIRLDGSEIFLINQSDKFVRKSSQKLLVYQSLKDAWASYPNTGGPGFISDLDAALAWCSKPHPKPIVSVDQSHEFWRVTEFLEEVEADGMLDDDALHAFRMANDVRMSFFWAASNFFGTAANPSFEDSVKLQAMFELGICYVVLTQLMKTWLLQKKWI